MLTLLHTLPNAVLFLVVCGTLVGLASLAPRLGDRLGIRQDEDRSKGALEAFKATAAAAVLVLAFSLSQVNTTLRAAQEAVAREAAAITVLDRTFLRIGAPELEALRPVLAEYGRAIVAEEWPLLGVGRASEKASEMANVLSRTARRFEPSGARQSAMFSSLLRHLDDLSELREVRLVAAGGGLPSLFYATALGLCGILFLLALLVAPAKDNALHIAGMTGTVALVLSLVIVLDRPFSGETQVSPEPIERSLARNAARVS